MSSKTKNVRNLSPSNAKNGEPHPVSGPFRIPAVDILEKEHEYIIEADMPGCTRESIDIQYQGGELTIFGKLEACEKSDENKGGETGENKTPEVQRNYRLQQYEYYDYSRMFRVGDSVDTEKIEADYNKGVLRLKLPKSESHKPRKIDVLQNK